MEISCLTHCSERSDSEDEFDNEDDMERRPVRQRRRPARYSEESEESRQNGQFKNMFVAKKHIICIKANRTKASHCQSRLNYENLA